MLVRYVGVLVLGISLAACGGGGGDASPSPGPDNPPSSGGSPNPTPTPGGPSSGGSDSGSGGSGGIPPANDNNGSDGSPSPITLTADRDSTYPGGTPITLTASSEQDTGIQWQLATGSMGSLSSNTGTSIQYLPPAAGTPVTNSTVNIIATQGEASDNIVLLLNAAPAVQPPPPPTVDEPGDTSLPGIYLLAGNDFGAGFANGTGAAARFAYPMSVAQDASGNLYVADQMNSAIRRVTPEGAVTLFAGLPGDTRYQDGTRETARFDSPSAITVDANGNLYVADLGTIRRVTPSGAVSTVAGRYRTGSARDGTGSEALFNSPSALTMGPDGNVYIADDDLVRRMTPDGVVTTIAGSGRNGFQDGPGSEATFVQLNGITVDNDGNIYVTDGGWQRNGGMMSNDFVYAASIRRIAPDGTVSTVAGLGSSSGMDNVTGYVDGNGSAARFSYPWGIAADAEGNLLVADRGNYVVRRVTPEGNVSTVAGVPQSPGSTDGGAGEARFNSLRGLSIGQNGVIHVVDTNDHTVRRITSSGQVSTLAGVPPRRGAADGVGSAATFNQPRGIARDDEGTLYVADTGNHTIRRITSDRNVTTLAGSPEQAGMVDGTGAEARFSSPTDVAVTSSGDILVADNQNAHIRHVTPNGTTTIAGEGRGWNGPSFRPYLPRSLDVDGNGNTYLTEGGSDNLLRVSPDGAVAPLQGGNLFMPNAVATDSQGNVYLIERHSVLRRIAPDGSMSTVAGVAFERGMMDGTGEAARFMAPNAIAIDENDNIYVADTHAIRRVTPQGEVTTVAGSPVTSSNGRLRSIYRPMGLEITGPKTLAYTTENGVFEIRLP